MVVSFFLKNIQLKFSIVTGMLPKEIQIKMRNAFIEQKIKESVFENKIIWRAIN